MKRIVTLRKTQEFLIQQRGKHFGKVLKKVLIKQSKHVWKRPETQEFLVKQSIKKNCKPTEKHDFCYQAKCKVFVNAPFPR